MSLSSDGNTVAIGARSNDGNGTNSGHVRVCKNWSGGAYMNITVTPVNDGAPTITSTAVTTIAEDSAYTYTVTTNDVDGDTVTLAGTTIPSWLSFNTGTGVLSGTPTNDDVGIHNVVITATDGNGGSVTDEFSINVKNVNDAPTITSTAGT